MLSSQCPEEGNCLCVKAPELTGRVTRLLFSLGMAWPPKTLPLSPQLNIEESLTVKDTEAVILHSGLPQNVAMHLVKCFLYLSPPGVTQLQQES